MNSSFTGLPRGNSSGAGIDKVCYPAVTSAFPTECNDKHVCNFSKLAGATGFEPVAFGFGVGDPGHPAESEASRSLTLRTVTDSVTSPNVSPRPADHGQFAALVLHGSRSLVSPKEAALRLGIKLSTVYRLCAKGALPHVRLGSLLRIDVESYLASPRSWNRKP